MKKVKQKAIYISISAIILLLILYSLYTRIYSEKEVSSTIFAMDTVMTLSAQGKNAEKAISEATREISRLDNLLSVNNHDSDIYKLNTEKEAVVSEDTYNIIKRALSFCDETEALLDIAIYPVVREWGFTTGKYKVPSDEDLEKLKNHISPECIVLNDDTKTISLTDSEAEIDLGAVAKGYASDRVIDIFKKYDIKSGIISLGGNVNTLGQKKKGVPWKVAIQAGENENEFAGILEVSDKAVVTSGDYQRFFEQDGVRYHHIIDPKTCKPAKSGLSSVTIVSSDGFLADAYSTALFIMGKEKAADFWRKNRDNFDFVLIENNGDISVTEGLKDSFETENEDSTITYNIIYAEQ